VDALDDADGNVMVPDETLSVAQARKLISAALTGAGTSHDNARYFTEAILDTEMSGLAGHGFYWLQYYCQHVQSGKVDGKAKPRVKMLSPVAIEVDAKCGFAHPAIEAGFAKLVPAAKKFGVATMIVKHSYNAATLGYHTGALAKQGLLAFGFTNSVPAIAPVGGVTPVIGTNPMSFAVPAGKGKMAFLIDQSSSATAWTNVKTAGDEGRSIPLGWALDKNGQPTDDPVKGLAGSMAPAGGYKGFGQGLIVEVMCAALAQSLRGPQMGSFSENDGKPIGCGQAFIAFDPVKFGGAHFHKQVKALSKSIVSQKGARMPNSRRTGNIKAARSAGVVIEAGLLKTLRSFAR
jgi:(2R)-3-sulfolactate dehydrogenase (NADP+)